MKIELEHINPDSLNDIASLKEVVVFLINVVERDHNIIEQQRKRIQLLEDEVNRLKKEQGKPDIKANTQSTETESKDIGNSTDNEETIEDSETNSKPDISTGGKETEKKKHNRTAKKANIAIDKTEELYPDKSELPPDAVFKYWDSVITQDVIFKRCNTLYQVAVYYSETENKTYRSPLPNGASYHSAGLKNFIYLQNKICNVTSQKVLDLLASIGIEISTGALSKILLAPTDLVEADKSAILKAGLSASYTQTDITGARVAGKNHYTHIITNDFFTTFTTLDGKSTLDVLAAFQMHSHKNDLGLIYNQETVKLLEEGKISVKDRESLADLLGDEQTCTLQKFEELVEKEIPDLYNKRNTFIKVKTVFALAYYHYQDDVPQVERLVSDNAPEYNKIATKDHALCWVHDARYYKKLTPFIVIHQNILNQYLDKYWSFYHELQAYKKAPTQEWAWKLSDAFDVLFTPNTSYEQLNERISKTLEKKQELLLVLRYPEIPLHNNLAELGARKQVRKRDISFHTMTPEGTKNQDAFLTIVQTAKQLGVDVYKYIKELILDKKDRIPLADIIYQKIASNTS